MVDSSRITTDRLKVHLLQCGHREQVPFIFIHGNLSSGVFFTDTMLLLRRDYWCLAPDLRGYGDSENKLIDAGRGARDWSDDLFSLFDSLDIPQANLLGWSAGAGVVMQFMLDYPALVKSLILVAPLSPFGFGGTRDEYGTPCYDDFAGSGAGMVNSALGQELFMEDGINEMFARELFESFYLYRKSSQAEHARLIEGIIKQATGEWCYPGDPLSSDNWPYFRPGQRGPMNALSPRNYNTSMIDELATKPPILWIQGKHDQIISNHSSFDPAVQGARGELESWPGNSSYPAQPMVDQMSMVLQHYKRRGGNVQKSIFRDSAHAPFLDQPLRFIQIIQDFYHSVYQT